MYSGLKKYTIRGLSFCRVGQFNLGKWSRSKQGNISASGTPHANSSLNINYYLSKRSSKISRARREKKWLFMSINKSIIEHDVCTTTTVHPNSSIHKRIKLSHETPCPGTQNINERTLSYCSSTYCLCWCDKEQWLKFTFGSGVTAIHQTQGLLLISTFIRVQKNRLKVKNVIKSKCQSSNNTTHW